MRKSEPSDARSTPAKNAIRTMVMSARSTAPQTAGRNHAGKRATDANSLEGRLEMGELRVEELGLVCA